VNRFFLTLTFLTGAAGLPAQTPAPSAAMPPAAVEDEREPTPGEQEESPELLPEVVIPYHESMVELPGWMDREMMEIHTRQRPANHGGGLFPPQVWPMQPEPPLGPLQMEEAPAAVPPSPGLGPVPLGPELMALYTSQLPAGVFSDPQHLVKGRSEVAMESLVQRWLNDQCAFRTTVLVFGEGQQLPSEFDPQALRRQWFGEDGDSLLVFYFYQQPERTLAIFGQGARATYGESLLRSVVDAAVTEAGRVEGGPEQLERFCYKMSVRLHWLHRTHQATAAKAETAGPETAAPGPWGKRLLMAVLGGAMATGAVLGALALRRRWRQGQSATGPVILPECEVTARLGAPHCGGFSAVISFAPQIKS
jgi:hypothetical protein